MALDPEDQPKPQPANPAQPTPQASVPPVPQLANSGDISGQLMAPGAAYSQIEQEVLSGKVRFQDLGEAQQRLFADQMIKRNGYYTPGTVYSPEALNTLQGDFQSYLQHMDPGFKLPGWLKPLEWLGSKLYWTYSNFVSRPLSSAILYASDVADDGDGSWNKSWRAAEYTSPGQSAWLAFQSDEELRKNGIDPNDLVKSREAVDKYFTKGAQKWVSGTTDFAVAWYADPFVLSLRGVGAARRASYVRPVNDPTKINKYMNSGAMTGLFNLVDGYRAQYGIDEGVNRLVKQVPSFRNSNNGSGTRLAEALMKAENSDDMERIMRMSLGDRAIFLEADRLAAQTASRLNIAVSKESSLTLTYANMANKSSPAAQLTKTKLDNMADEIGQLDGELGTLTREVELFGTVDKLYFNAVTTPVGAAMRGMFYDANTSFAKKGDPARKLFGAPVRMGSQARFSGVARLAYNGLYVTPVRIARSFVDSSPTHYIRLNDPDSYRTVEANLRDTPLLSPETKAKFVGRYINASEVDRPQILQQIEAEAVTAMARRHGLSADVANAIYRDFYGRRVTASTGGDFFSTAKLSDGTGVHVVEKNADGSITAISPVLSSQMAESWVMMDVRRMDKLMRQSGPVIQRLIDENPSMLDDIRRGLRVKGDQLGSIAEVFNNTWKFLQLARIGYGPRAISDELMSQVAAGGMFAFLARSGHGTVNQFFRGRWASNYMAQNNLMRADLDDLIRSQSQTVDDLNNRLVRLSDAQQNPNLTRAQRASLHRRWLDVEDKLKVEIESLSQIRNRHAAIPSRNTMEEGITTPGGVSFRGATEAEGIMFRNQLSVDESMRNLLGTRAGASGRSLYRPGNTGWGRIAAEQDEATHMSAWLRALNFQIRNDKLAMVRVLNPDDDQAMLRFLGSREGAEYKQNSPFKAMTNDEIVERVAAHVDMYMPTSMVGRAELGAKMAHSDLTGAELKKAIPRVAQRPDVHNQQLDWALGGHGAGGDVARMAEGVIQNFYKFMNKLPAERLSRNPLFAQLYKSHLKDLAKGIEPGRALTPREYLAYENAARTRAISDVKRLTFNMDYETRIAHSLRFVAPFFGAQMESWQRWARIIADKPQVAAHAVNLYNAPMRSGNATTFDGDKVDGYGYATNQLTGEKYKVDKSDIYLNMPVPKAMLKSLASMSGRDVNELRIPINSLNLVLSGDPVFMPGWGPVVQIPANDFIRGGPLDPTRSGGQWGSEDFFKEIGVLPFGVRESSLDFINPASGRRLADSEDEFGSKFQSNLAQIMAEEQWKFDEGLRETQPTMNEMVDKARQFSKFEMWAGWVLPFSASYKTPMSFYGDMYKKMVREDPERGADAFRDKFGDSMWMFTAQLSKNNTGLSATGNAIYSQKAMQQAIDTSSAEFAGDISHILSGPYATGDWSNGAYYYQLNSPIQSGGTERQRERIGAVEAMSRAEEQRGWYLYNKMMLPLNAQLFQRGLRSFDDKGAEDLRAKKIAAAEVLSDQYMPDGTTKNPYYNEEWSKAYTTLDTGKYDRFAENLEKVMGNIIPFGLSQGGRTDLNSLIQYLSVRKSVNAELALRKSQDINAKSNRDLKKFMTENTMTLIEKDTRFNELHNRYFSRDMGFDMHNFSEE